jgi:hypothetical protein
MSLLLDALHEQTVADAIQVLNEVLQADPVSAQQLFELRTIPTLALINHPTVQVQEEKGGGHTFSVMGLINGLFGTMPDGRGWITSVWDDAGKLIGFKRTE